MSQPIGCNVSSCAECTWLSLQPACPIVRFQKRVPIDDPLPVVLEPYPCNIAFSPCGLPYGLGIANVKG